ncbi:MAG: hypothetical protein KDA24_25755 [Deltaproteobacteria bacterium]|nr:hypothetical protein [Deltaproteobacteria bacterium]
MPLPSPCSRTVPPGPLLLVVIALLAHLAGCEPPPEAPTELSDLSRYLYREYNDEDERVMQAGARNMYDFLSTLDLEGERSDRSFEPEDLQDEDVADITRPDRPLENCLPLGIGGVSRHPIENHALLMIQPDQTEAEASANFYDRSFPETSDPTCFLDRTCDLIVTVNDAERQNLLLKVQFILFKNFRWVEILDEDGEHERWAIVARSWFEQEWEGESGENALLQSYASDLWFENDDGTVWRYQTLWSESRTTPAAEDNVVLGILRTSIDGSFGRADNAIDTLLE